MKTQPQAEKLNDAINKINPRVYRFLSERGRLIYFPRDGIIAQSSEAKGKKYNATIGDAFEDDGAIMHLSSAGKNILLKPNEVFSYAPSYGIEDLRKSWKEFICRKNPSLKQSTSLPVVTSALTHALSIAGFLFIDRGDKIILADRYWENYKLIFEIGYGARFNTFSTFANNEFDINSFKKRLIEKSRKKIVLLNFPNNPTGYTPTIKEAMEIVNAIKKSAESGDKLIIILDDAYFNLVYKNGVCRESLFSWLSGLHENVLAVKVDGPTKEDYAWGLRVGFITYGIKNGSDELYRALEDKTAGAVRATISNASNLSQNLLLRAYQSPTYEAEKKEKYGILKSRYEKVQKILEDNKFSEFFTPLPSNSGYFVCLKLNNGIDAEKLRKLLLEKYDTGIIVSGNLARVAFSSIAANKIEQLFENIYNGCKDCSIRGA